MLSKILVILAVILLPALAASANRFNIITFRPTVGEFISVDDTTIHPFRLGTMLDFGYRPLDLKSGGATEREVVNDLFVQHVYGAVPIASWLSAGLDMPIAWRYSFANPDTAVAENNWRTSLGDLSVSAKAAVYNNDAVGIAIVPFATLPTGDDDHFMGNRGVAGGGQLAFVAKELFDTLTMGINAGALFRKHVQLSNIDLGDQLLLSASAKARLTRNTSFIVEAETSTPVTDAFRDRNTTPVSARGAFELKKGGIKALAGVGGGIIHGGGAPMVNGFAMLEFAPFPKKGQGTPLRDAQPVEPTPREATLMFKFASAVISDGAAMAAGSIAEAAFYGLPERKLRVIGHADSIGGEAYNMRLSEERARRVARYLEMHGVSRDRMVVEWKGGFGGPENRKVTINFE